MKLINKPVYEEETGFLYSDANKTNIINFMPSKPFNGILVIPENVKSINSNFHLIKGIEFKNKELFFMKELAFFGDDLLEYVNLENTLCPRLNEAVFFNCTNLKKVILPPTFEVIDKYLFANCYFLENIIFPDTLHTIHTGAFQDCKSITNFIFPNNICHVSPHAFDGCKATFTISNKEILEKKGMKRFANYYKDKIIIDNNSLENLLSKGYSFKAINKILKDENSKEINNER